jgi:hypothetical protein
MAAAQLARARMKWRREGGADAGMAVFRGAAMEEAFFLFAKCKRMQINANRGANLIHK